MAKRKLEIEGSQIVLRGSFNTLIFQPAWLAAQGLIRESESESAEIAAMGSELVAFDCEWFSFEASASRLAVSTTQSAYFEAVRDLVVGTFEILTHSPVNMMGLNYQVHIRIASEEEWHALGHLWAPKKPWGFLNEPGLRELAMQGKRTDDYTGGIQVKVEPSVQVKPGIFISINDHYEIKDHPPEKGSREILEMLKEKWEESHMYSKSIVEQIMNLELP